MALTAIRMTAVAGVLAMVVAIARAFTVASFPEDGATLLALAWGQVTLVDLYLALLLGWGWIAWRERSVPRALGWLVATVTLGSLALFVYLLRASVRAQGPTEVVVGPHRGPVAGRHRNPR